MIDFGTLFFFLSFDELMVTSSVVITLVSLILENKISLFIFIYFLFFFKFFITLTFFFRNRDPTNSFVSAG